MRSLGEGWRIRLGTWVGLTVALFTPIPPGIAGETLPGRDDGLTELMASGDLPGFPGWVSRRELFTSLPRQPTLTNGSVPLIVSTHFNQAAAQHIRGLGLHLPGELAAQAGRGKKRVPALPDGARIAMVAWWPVARNGFTPVPIWRPAEAGGHGAVAGPTHTNGYLNWDTVVAVSPQTQESGPDRLVFAGRSIDQPAHKTLDDMVFKTLDAESAKGLMAQPAARKLSGLVLGRAMASGDHLALVGLHLFSANPGQGRWETYWWQPAGVAGDALEWGAFPSSHYQSDVVTDAVVPRERDGSPNIGFNPWFEGGLVPSDQGRAGQSNCLSCHLRAAYPPEDFLTITRGATRPTTGAVATGMIWSLAIGHRPLENVIPKP